MNVPKLRFPEFKDEWDRFILGSILKYEQPTKYIVKSDEYDPDAKIPVLTANKSFILGYTNDEEGVYTNECILFDDFTLNIKYVDFHFKVKSSALKILTLKNKDESDLIYVYNLLLYKNFQPQAHKRHWISDISERYVLVASKKEQEKIGKFFATLDKEIEYMKKKQKYYKKYKKYYFQNLYVSDKSDKPNLRFKYFSEQWKKYKLKDITKLYSSNIAIKDLLESGKVPIYDMNKIAGYLNDCQCISREYIRIVKDGSVGELSISEPNTYFTSTMNGIVANKGYDIIFLYGIMKRINYNKYVKGSIVPHIYYKDYGEHEDYYPSLEEQEKIGKFFSILDKRIELIDKKIQLLEKRKKAFLQQMFV